MRSVIHKILKEEVKFKNLPAIFKVIDRHFSLSTATYFRQATNRKWIIKKKTPDGDVIGSSINGVQDYIKDLGFSQDDSQFILHNWVSDFLIKNKKDYPELFEEDLEYYSVDDATKDTYKMGIQEDVPVYTESNPHKKVWKNFRKGFPTTPEYVLKDFFTATFVKSPENMKEVIKKYDGDPLPYLGNYWHDFFNGDWKLQVLNVNPLDFSETTLNAFLERSFGDENAYLVPGDEERTKIQKEIAKGKGMNEPIIIVKGSDDKYEVIEGWHRTMASLLLGDNGEDLKNWDNVKIRAWVTKGK